MASEDIFSLKITVETNATNHGHRADMNCFYHISFIFFILKTSPSNALYRRCVDADEIGIEEGPLVSTLNGDILGYKETKVDPRQNKSVTWTSFYVGVTIYFFGPIAHCISEISTNPKKIYQTM